MGWLIDAFAPAIAANLATAAIIGAIGGMLRGVGAGLLVAAVVFGFLMLMMSISQDAGERIDERREGETTTTTVEEIVEECFTHDHGSTTASHQHCQ